MTLTGPWRIPAREITKRPDDALHHPAYGRPTHCVYCRYGRNSGPSSSRLMISRMMFMVPSAPME